ncbi:MAG: FecR domain-containing protein [Bacteroidales bacterium]|nr:FecR domain-containing protein [Bacteroidales bacterium]
MKLNINNTKDFELIARYFAGEMSNEEVFQFEKQIEIFPENKNLIEEMKKQWEQIGGYQKKEKIDTNKGWQTLYNRLSVEDLIPENRIVEHRIIPTWTKWAASITVLIIIAGLSFYSITRNNNNLISLQTGSDSNTLIQTLTDGSVVYLANNTTFSYPSEFDAKERKVNLKGEAFFDITPNPKKPFKIETEKVIVEVLGTAFNVKTENSNQFELLVERGKVRVTLKSDPSQTQIVLPGEKISTSNNHLIKMVYNNTAYFSWKTQRMQFKDESLCNIINIINKNYKTNIQLQNQILGERKLTVTFYNNSLKTITELICLSLNLEAKEGSDSTIIIKPVEK